MNGLWAKALFAGMLLSLSTASFAGQESDLYSNLDAGKAQTVVAYGTSLTASGAWVQQLGDDLNQRYPGRATVINSGKGSMWSGWGVENLDSRVISKSPDTVFIEFAINDAFLPHKTTVEQARKNLELMIDRIKAAKASTEIILMVTNPVTGGSGVERPKLRDYFQMYRDVAKAKGLRLIDNYPKWEAVLKSNPDLFNQYVADGLHPNADGYRAVVVPSLIENLSGASPN
ncbi:SGNH/GDSL hydrolase family protein [Pseudomonas frederiksbergensis]|uniref:SGNH/GDSL hydrolase family protein n=1 Tax=Pseudomonas frederiksbergensis TaxID=104087 RepID=UPI003CFF7739